MFKSRIAMAFCLTLGSASLAPGMPLLGCRGFEEGSGGTADDSGGYGSAGTLIGPPSWENDRPALGDGDWSVFFHDVPDRVRVGNTKSLRITESLRIEAYARPTAHLNYDPIVAKWSNNPQLTTDLCLFMLTSQSLYFGLAPLGVFSDRDHVDYMLAPDEIPVDAWTHVAAEYDRVSRRMSTYVNGLERARRVSTITSIRGTLAPFDIAYCEGNYFNGYIDEVEVYGDKPAQFPLASRNRLLSDALVSVSSVLRVAEGVDQRTQPRPASKSPGGWVYRQ